MSDIEDTSKLGKRTRTNGGGDRGGGPDGGGDNVPETPPADVEDSDDGEEVGPMPGTAEGGDVAVVMINGRKKKRAGGFEWSSRFDGAMRNEACGRRGGFA